MIYGSRRTVVLDTSVLVNFLRIDRMELIANHTHEFIVTNHVGDEITDYYPDQQARLEAAMAARALRQVSVAHPGQLRYFVSLSATRRLGAGECSAIALAAHQGFILAIDDRRAANEARRVSENIQIMATPDLMVSMIRQQLLNVQQADGIKGLWAADHRFRLKVQSFRDLLDS